MTLRYSVCKSEDRPGKWFIIWYGEYDEPMRYFDTEMAAHMYAAAHTNSSA